MNKDNLLERLRGGETIEALADEYAKALTAAENEYKKEQEALRNRKMVDKQAKYDAAAKVASSINDLVSLYTKDFERIDASSVLEVADAFLNEDFFNQLIKAFLR